jgi:glycosyltransferase involved in cell wall biosynthesis
MENHKIASQNFRGNCGKLEVQTMTARAASGNEPKAGLSFAVFTCSSVDTDYFQYLNDILREEGFPVLSIAPISEFEYRRSSRSRGWRKLRLRAGMYIGYPLQVLRCACAAPSKAVFIVTSNTFYTPLLVALIGKLKKFRTVNLVYDLFPDALEVSGKWKRNGLGVQACGWLARLIKKSCDVSVFLGDFLRMHAVRRWGSPILRTTAIHIGADVNLFNSELRPAASESICLHYGGQLGYMHDPDSLIESLIFVARSNFSNVRVSLLLSGAHAERIERSLLPFGIEVSPAIPSGEWRERIKAFHIGLVSLSPGGATVCLPSKTYSMMAGGLAIIAICPLWSDLARVVLDNNAGWVINNSRYSSREELEGPDYFQKIEALRPVGDIARDFGECISAIISNRTPLDDKRRNARAAVARYYSREALAAQWRELLDGVTSRN